MWNIAICDDEQTVQQELSALWQKAFYSRMLSTTLLQQRTGFVAGC